MKKKGILILTVLLMAIGFAVITTSVVLNGSVSVAANTNDFDVYFSKVLVNGVEDDSVYQDDTHLSFDANLTTVGQEYILTYDVTNGSSEYDIDAKINIGTYDTEYLEVKNEFDTSTLFSKETRTGKLTIKLIKSYEEDTAKENPISVELVFDAVERTSIETKDTASKKGTNLYNMMKANAKTNAIDFSVNSMTSGTNGIYTTTETDTGKAVYYYRDSYTALNNNLIFNNMCWKIIRTTETGGVKIIYNGTPSDGKCETQTGDTTQIAEVKFNEYKRDNGYVGYMYGDDTNWKYINNGMSSETSSITFDSGNKYVFSTSYNFDDKAGFTLSGTISSGTWSSDLVGLYTCQTTSISNGCDTIYYISAYESETTATVYKITVTYSGSKSYEEAHANINDSTVKKYVENWYSTNFTDTNVTNKIEDTVYCNDRSTGNYDKNKIGDSYTNFSSYGPLGYEQNLTLYGASLRSSYYTINPSPSLKCINANDKFTVSVSNGNGALTYPVGLITLDEAVLAGFNTHSSDNVNFKDTTNYLSTNKYYWTMSPVVFYGGNHAGEGRIGAEGYVLASHTWFTQGVRPVISLKNGILASGDGSTINPYVV